MPAVSKRDQIVSQALSLFYQEGFNATGVDRVSSEAGVSKKTLYNHFKSKDELVMAVLRKRDELLRNKMMRDTERLGAKAKDRLLSIFDVHDAWFNEKDFCGCMFINAAAEFAELQDPIHMISTEHKRLVRGYLAELAQEAGANDPTLLAAKLHLLLEGAIVEAHVSANKNAAKLAKTMAAVLIEQAF